MAGGFRISFVSDVREVLRGNEAMEKGFDQTADSLDGLAREAKNAGSKVENSLDDIGDAAKDAGNKIERELEGATKEAGGEADRLEKKFRDAFRDIERHSDDASDSVRKDAKRIENEGGESVAEFKDEARQNFGEITSSFTGDMDSIVDLAQGTFGGLAGTLTGPLGLAFGGLAATAGLFYSAWQENAEKTEQRVSDMYEDMRESGLNYLSESYITDQIDAIVSGSEDAVRTYEQVVADAKLLGVNTSTVLRAWSGDQDAINEVIGATNDALDDTSAKFQQGTIDSGEFAGTRFQINEVKNGLLDTAEGAAEVADKVGVARQAIAELPSNKTTDVTVNTQPGRMGMGDFYRDPAMFGQRSVDVGMNPRASTAQFQEEADRAARSVRPPVITIRGALGITRAV